MSVRVPTKIVKVVTIRSITNTNVLKGPEK